MRRRNWWLVLVLLLAAALRFFRLGARSLWFDEALSVLIGRLTLQQVLTGAAGSSHPPGYYLLLHIWQAVGMGTDDWLLRYPSVLASVLSVALVHRVASLIFDRRTGLVAALGMALAPFQVYYAQEARMYALATGLTLGVAWCFIYAVKAPRSWAAWSGYVILAVLGLYTHYFVAWALLSFHLWLFLAKRWPLNLWLCLLCADAAVGLMFLPQVGQAMWEAGEFMSKEWRGSPSLLAPLTMPEYLIFGHVVPVYWWWGVRVSVVTVLLAFVLLEWARGRNRVRRRWVGLTLLVAVLPPFLVVAISWLFQPLYLVRSFAMLAPFLVLFMAQGVAAASPRRSPVPWVGFLLGALMLVGTVLSFTQPDIAKPAVGEAMSIVARDYQEGDLCLHLDETYLSALVYEPQIPSVLLEVGQVPWLQPAAYRLLGGRVSSTKDLPSGGRLWLVVTDRSSQPWEGVLGQIEQERQLGGLWKWEFLSVYRYD